jgi:uncharacterized integral membrane protein (TIGR00698 family)
MTAQQPDATGARAYLDAAMEVAPGLGLSIAVALAAYGLAQLLPRGVPLPAIVLALFIGMLLHAVARMPAVQPGIAFSVRTLLRWAIALLGLRVSLTDIAALGPSTAGLIVGSMVVTIVAGFAIARMNRQPPGFGALAGAATAVCGASATLATATVVPNYPGKQADVVFVVIGTNALATLALVIYPPLCALIGLDPQATGVMLGGTIHDMAQVVGAGYAVSEPVGNAAVIVKLFRVFLLLPVVLSIGWYFRYSGDEPGAANVPVPVFALVFLMLCLVNSAVPFVPELVAVYAPIRAVLIDCSSAGLLIAIGALGLGTSPAALAQFGWRHAATVLATTVIVFAIVTGGLLAFQQV